MTGKILLSDASLESFADAAKITDGGGADRRANAYASAYTASNSATSHHQVGHG